ncbi:hypothetical protein M9458_035441, partial [Cirrhinus mrigala]
VRDAVFCAGQIALVPCSMQLVNGPVALQARLCFSHMEKAHIYITHREHAAVVTETWNAKLRDIQ